MKANTEKMINPSSLELENKNEKRPWGGDRGPHNDRIREKNFRVGCQNFEGSIE